jgi:hypothetical protein
MAKIENNLIIHGLSGMLGKQVVVRRMKNGHYVLAAKPAHRLREATDAQKQQREKFRQAVLYAKGAKGTAEYRDAAELRCISAFNVAIADFLHPPEIQKIDISAYRGAIDEPIRITAVDDVKVKTVRVMIVNGDGTLVEKGTAVSISENANEWLYTTTCAAGSSSVKIVVDVVDVAGQVTEVTEHT